MSDPEFSRVPMPKDTAMVDANGMISTAWLHYLGNFEKLTGKMSGRTLPTTDDLGNARKASRLKDTPIEPLDVVIPPLTYPASFVGYPTTATQIYDFCYYLDGYLKTGGIAGHPGEGDLVILKNSLEEMKTKVNAIIDILSNE